ncbi:MAG: hypothetical protein EAZ85_12335 [Bacteroidetes bacterium]|nr:MAG: hypothetical protein EAZ85_12335 [Bacteroidota bacterium]TAG86116.1 MAG: hypothetical protein EAZ20_13460 [Bacteroidota bacterium]
MSLIVKTEKGQQINLEDTPFTSGGEGELYKIISPNSLNKYCVKIYYSQYQTQQKYEKLRFMINHKPQQITDKTNYMICWVDDLVFRDDNFVGFLMPLAFDNSIQLYELCTTKIKKNLKSTWYQKFDRDLDPSIENRLKLCVNIAIAIHNIHNTQKYVLVDMKPQNILICPEGKVSIVDLDSIQISNGVQIIHHGHVATPEYTPIEGRRINPSNDFVPESWDRFSLAIIFYEIIFGIHPFVATSIGKYKHITTIEDAIKNELFVFGSNSEFLELPPPHNKFHLLPQNIKNYFIKALDKGYNNPAGRPTAEDWGKMLFEELRLETEKTDVYCPVCKHIMSVPKYKHVRVNCPKCKTNIEIKNGSLSGYIGENIVEKKVYVDKVSTENKPNEKFITYLLAIAMIIGFIWFLSLNNNSSNIQNNNENNTEENNNNKPEDSLIDEIKYEKTIFMEQKKKFIDAWKKPNSDTNTLILNLTFTENNIKGLDSDVYEYQNSHKDLDKLRTSFKERKREQDSIMKVFNQNISTK